jgi:hypothetical protein
MRGIANDALSIHWPMIASAFVARWCVGHKAEATNGLFRVREDEPKRSDQRAVALNSLNGIALIPCGG